MRGSFIQLDDGRKLAYMEYGAQEGLPLLLFHGTPGSRLWFLEDDDIARSLGIRLITTDRPGFGASDPKPGRTVLDWANDVEQLADQLHIGNTFSVLGVSGGGVYAAACAHQLPERLQSVVMVASAAPFIKGKPPKEMNNENRMAFSLGNRLPWLLKYSYRMQRKMIQSKPEQFIAAMRKGNHHLTEWDRAFLQTDEQLEETMLHLGEAIRLRVDGAVDEIRLLSKPWGFNVADIRIPVHIWHGEADRMAPYSETEQLARQIPRSTFYSIPNAGHFLTSDESIWTSILNTVKSDMLQS